MPASGTRTQVRPAGEGNGAQAPAGKPKLAGYVASLRRFWWILVIGAAVALVTAISTLYHVSFFPPSLESREVVTYTSSARLLVTSDQASHLRSQITIFGPRQTDEDAASEEGAEGEGDQPEGEGEGQNQGQGQGQGQADPFNAPPGQEVVGVASPDSGGTLIRAANLFPLLIESDEVAAYRRAEFGDIPGSVTAKGVYSFSTANRFELSQIPVVTLDAVSSDPESAVALADATAKAFIGWTQTRQQESKIPRQDRIVVEQLNAPQAAASGSGPSKAMPVLIFVFILGAFVLLAVLLDRLFPPKTRPVRADVEPIERRVKVKKSA